MGKKNKKIVAMLPNLEYGDRIVIGKSVYEFAKIKNINDPHSAIVFIRQGLLEDENKRGTGRDRVR